MHYEHIHFECLNSLSVPQELQQKINEQLFAQHLERYLERMVTTLVFPSSEWSLNSRQEIRHELPTEQWKITD